MNNPRHPFRINIGFIISQSLGYHRDCQFEYPRLQIGDDLDIRLLLGVARISRTPQGLLVQANFSGRIFQECVRCLTEYEHTLKWEFTEMYAFNKKQMTDSGLLIPDDAHIDLEPLVRDYALLEIPLKPICKKECRGLCFECGEDLNTTSCGHKPQNDSPFAVLKDLLNDQ